MNKKLNIAVFLEFVVGCGLGIFFHWVLNYKEAAYIIFGMGVLLSTMTYLLREELSRVREGLITEYKQSHEIIFALSHISDPECRAKAEEFLNGVKKTFGSLQQGYIPLGEMEFWLEAARAVDSAHVHIRAVDPLTSAWDSSGAMVNVYNANLRAIERGIRISRVFIINRDSFGDSDTQRILSCQLKSGVDVRIVYRDEVPTVLDSTWSGPISYNFAVYDDQLVTDVYATPGQYFGRKTIQSSEVGKYLRILELIEHNAYRLSLENDRLTVSSLAAAAV